MPELEQQLGEEAPVQVVEHATEELKKDLSDEERLFYETARHNASTHV